MAKQVVTRTYTASIRNQSRRFKTTLIRSGSQLRNSWNVGRWMDMQSDLG